MSQELIAIIGAAIALAGLILNGQRGINDLRERVGRIEVSIADLRERMGKIEIAVADLRERITKLEISVTELRERMARVEGLFEGCTKQGGNPAP